MKSYYQMTGQEIEAAKKPTPKEAEAIRRFLDAAKALPSRCYISFSDYERGENNLNVGVRVCRGCGQGVDGISKKSLTF